MDASVVSTILTDCGTVVNQVITTMTGNPILAVCLGFFVLGSGARFVRKLKSTSK